MKIKLCGPIADIQALVLTDYCHEHAELSFYRPPSVQEDTMSYDTIEEVLEAIEEVQDEVEDIDEQIRGQMSEAQQAQLTLKQAQDSIDTLQKRRVRRQQKLKRLEEEKTKL
jgi:DNA repair exonuclease SbcCD ATPase subunit